MSLSDSFIWDPLDLPTPSNENHHLVQFYDDESFLVNVLSLFTRKGLQAGDGVIVIATKPRLEVIESSLNSLEPDLKSRAQSRGQLVLLDAEHALSEILLKGTVDPLKFKNSIGDLFQKMKPNYPKVRAYGEMAGLLWSRHQLSATLALENLWNELARVHTFRLLCVYTLSSFKYEAHGQAFDQICSEHTHVVPAEEFITLTDEESKRRMVAKLQQRSKELESERRMEEERIELIRREKEARAEAERANRSKDEFLAIVSHELRTPLQPILSWVELIQTGNLKPLEVKRGLQIIEKSAKIQTQMINDLLDISRVIAGKMKLEIRPLDLGQVVKAALESIKEEAEQAGIKIIFKIEECIFANGDPGRLQQVLWNLLSNAIKFTPRNGQINISLEVSGSNAKIVVKDSGRGIPGDFLPHLFERFRQEDSTMSRHKGGLGLGLAIVNSLVEQHDGTIRAESEGTGKGSTFTIFLPLLSRKSAIEGNLHSEGRTNVKTLPDLDGITILVIDDEADTREVITAALETCRAEVESAGSAAEALQKIERRLPDIILSDLGMPREDGYSFIRKLRKLNPSEGGRTPAIAFTAFANKEEAAEALRAGFQAHVGKPVDMKTLIRLIFDLTASNTRLRDDFKKNAA
ncbi:MAG: ATP-binding protein [Bdellovibrionia bacterium]